MIKKTIVTIAVVMGLTGCASQFSSIDPAGGNKYYLTEIHQTFPTISSDLYLCEAKSKEQMVCEEVE